MLEEKKPEETGAEAQGEHSLKKSKLSQKILLGVLLLGIALFAGHTYLDKQSTYTYLASSLVADSSLEKVNASSGAIEEYSYYVGNSSVEKKAISLIEEGLEALETGELKLRFLFLTALRMEEMGHFSQDTKDYFDEEILSIVDSLLENDSLDYVMEAYNSVGAFSYYSNVLDIIPAEEIIENQRPNIEAMLEDKDLLSILDYAQRNFNDWQFDRTAFSCGDLISYDEFVGMLEEGAISTIHLADEGGYYTWGSSGGNTSVNEDGSTTVKSQSTTRCYGDFKIVISSKEYSDSENASGSSSSSTNLVTFQGEVVEGTVTNIYLGEEDVLGIYYYPVEGYNNFVVVQEEDIWGLNFSIHYGNTIPVTAGVTRELPAGESASTAEKEEEEDENFMEFLADTGETYLFNIVYDMVLIIDAQDFPIYIGELYPATDATAYVLSAIFDENKMVSEVENFYDKLGNEIDLYNILQNGKWIEAPGEKYDAEGNLIPAELSFDKNGQIESQGVYVDEEGNTNFALYHYDENYYILESIYIFDKWGHKISVTENYYDSYGYLLN